MTTVLPQRVQWSGDRRRVKLSYAALSKGKVYRINFTNIVSKGEAIGHSMVAYTVNRLQQ